MYYIWNFGYAIVPLYVLSTDKLLATVIIMNLNYRYSLNPLVRSMGIHCRLLPLGKFNGIIQEPLAIYFIHYGVCCSIWIRDMWIGIEAVEHWLQCPVALTWCQVWFRQWSTGYKFLHVTVSYHATHLAWLYTNHILWQSDGFKALTLLIGRAWSGEKEVPLWAYSSSLPLTFPSPSLPYPSPSIHPLLSPTKQLDGMGAL